MGKSSRLLFQLCILPWHITVFMGLIMKCFACDGFDWILFVRLFLFGETQIYNKTLHKPDTLHILWLFDLLVYTLNTLLPISELCNLDASVFSLNANTFCSRCKLNSAILPNIIRRVSGAIFSAIIYGNKSYHNHQAHFQSVNIDRNRWTQSARWLKNKFLRLNDDSHLSSAVVNIHLAHWMINDHSIWLWTSRIRTS